MRLSAGDGLPPNRRLMNTFFFIGVLVMLWGNGIAQQFSPFSYADFLLERKQLDEIDRLLEDSQATEALKLAQSLRCAGILCRSKNLYIAIAYAKTGRFRPAQTALAKAMEQGQELKYLDTVLFAPILPKIRKKYPLYHQRYERRIDTALRAELIRMTANDQKYRPAFVAARQKGDSSLIRNLGRRIDSIDSDNLDRLYQMTEKGGWPGVQRVGHYVAGVTNPDPALVIIHSPERDNIRFLDIISGACRQGLESWFAAQTVMSNLLFRFATQEYPYVKLRHVFLTKEGRIDVDRSLLQLNVLTDLLRNNTWHDIELHPTTALSGGDPGGLLRDLKQQLMALGCSEERISLNESPIPVPDDSLGTYLFCFKRIRKQ